jgi:hypothetical protein
MKYIFAAVFLLLISFHVYSDEPDVVRNTRKLYLQIEDMIKKNNLYTVKIAVNETDFSLAGFGKYNKKYAFYYRIEEGRVLSIAKIKLDYQISGSKFSEDYIFNEDGVLLFAYISRELENIEERFYYKTGKISVIMYDMPDKTGKNTRIVLEKFAIKDIKRSEEIITEAESFLKFLSEIPGGAALK